MKATTQAWEVTSRTSHGRALVGVGQHLADAFVLRPVHLAQRHLELRHQLPAVEGRKVRPTSVQVPRHNTTQQDVDTYRRL